MRLPLAGRRGSLASGLGLVLLVILSACCSTRSYRGDGRFTDSCGTPDWHLWSLERFVLDLGELDLSTPGEHRFQVGSLPKANGWLLGLEVEPPLDRPPGELLDEAEIEVVMTNRGGQLVLSESKPIHRWIWTRRGDGSGPFFAYLAGETREIPLGGGNTRGEPVGVRAEGGWGTYFDPSRGSSYDLLVRILTPDPDAAQFDVRLLAIGSNFGGSL